MSNANLLKDPRQYTAAYLSTNGITVNERGELINPAGKNNQQLFDTMFLDYHTQVSAHNASEKQKASGLRNLVTAIPEKTLQKALDELVTDKKIEYRKQLIASFKCEKEDLSIVTSFIKAVTGKEDADDVAVMAHWLWQVKKKMKGETPSYHVMPILFGKQEGGKTVAMNKLIGPINNFRLNINLDQMADDRYYKSMSENFVIVFDEMQGAERTDIDALKKQVTIDDNDYRPLGTNHVFKVRQACSFIGATNRPVAEQIIDSTGMRRFWQVDCMDKLDWTTLSSLDYTALWKSIDENKPDGYILPQISTIRAKQDTMVAKEDIVVFMETFDLDKTLPLTKKITTADFYQVYRTWAENNGIRPLNNIWFGKKMSGKGFASKVTKIQGKSYNYFEVNDNASVQQSNIFNIGAGKNVVALSPDVEELLRGMK